MVSEIENNINKNIIKPLYHYKIDFLEKFIKVLAYINSVNKYFDKNIAESVRIPTPISITMSPSNPNPILGSTKGIGFGSTTAYIYCKSI